MSCQSVNKFKSPIMFGPYIYIPEKNCNLVGLQCVIVVFPDHSHLLFWLSNYEITLFQLVSSFTPAAS